MKAWFEARGRGPVEIQTGKTGQFDITVAGKLVYSRFQTGLIPGVEELEKLLS